MRKKRHLSIDEKRDWLAQIFRDVSGDYSQADKFKALAEDTRLAQLQEEQEHASTKQKEPPLQEFTQLADLLPPPIP